MRRSVLFTIMVFTFAFSALVPGARGADKDLRDTPLVQKMHDLEFNFSRIEFGILTNNRRMVKLGARAISRNELDVEEIKPYIKKNIEHIVPLIPSTLELIRQTALDMVEITELATMLELQQKANTIAEVCVGCHDLYRD